MSGHYTKRSLEILAYIINVGSATVRGIEAVLPGNSPARKPLAHFVLNGYLRRENRGDENLGALYVPTLRGQMFLRRLKSGTKEREGDFPEPRSHAPSGTYIPAAIHTRPGAQDFLALPSLRGSERVEHKLPISMAGGQ